MSEQWWDVAYDQDLEERLKNGLDPNKFYEGNNILLTLAKVPDVETVSDENDEYYYSNLTIKIMKLLLKYKADPNIQDADGKTALMYVSNVGNYDVMTLLLENGADIFIKDRHNRDVLYDKSKEMLDLLRKGYYTYQLNNLIKYKEDRNLLYASEHLKQKIFEFLY